MIVEMFPEGMIALQQELLTGYHITLCSRLKAAQDTDGPEFDPIAVIAAHCEIVMDGIYSDEKLIQLCDILREELIKRRDKIGIVNPTQTIILPN